MFKNELGQISFGQFGPCRASTVYNLNAKKVNDLPRYSVLVKYIVVGTHMHTSRTLTFLYEKKKNIQYYRILSIIVHLYILKNVREYYYYRYVFKKNWKDTCTYYCHVGGKVSMRLYAYSKHWTAINENSLIIP